MYRSRFENTIDGPTVSDRACGISEPQGQQESSGDATDPFMTTYGGLKYEHDILQSEGLIPLFENSVENLEVAWATRCLGAFDAFYRPRIAHPGGILWWYYRVRCGHLWFGASVFRLLEFASDLLNIFSTVSHQLRHVFAGHGHSIRKELINHL